jgi:hypothetical protein
LDFVQIDHTKVDVIVVDEQQRLPIGRSWITLAIDGYSRTAKDATRQPGPFGNGRRRFTRTAYSRPASER